MSLNEGLAATIRTVMKQKRMTLTEFSEELGISRAALHDYIRAKGNPSAATIEHIARQMGVSTAALFAGTEEQREIVLLLLDTIQEIAELPEEKRLQMAEHFLAMVKLWSGA